MLPVEFLDRLLELLGLLNEARALVEASLDVPQLHSPVVDLRGGEGRMIEMEALSN